MVRPHPLLSPQRQAEWGNRADHAPAARGRSGRPRTDAGGLGGRPSSGDPEEDGRHLIDTFAGPRVLTRPQGETLHPEREPLPMLEQIRKTIGE